MWRTLGPDRPSKWDSTRALNLTTWKGGGGHNLPARFEQVIVPYLKPGEHADGRDAEQDFGGDAIDALLDNMREQDRLNSERLAMRPHDDPYTGTRLAVIASYRNIRGQWYSARLTVPISLSATWILCSPDKPTPRIPGPEDTDDLIVLAFPRAAYVAEPVLKEKIVANLEMRDERRRFSGW
jgi:hypothetical protein